MTLHPLDTVVLTHDIPAHGLRTGDLGAVVEIYAPNAVGVEFVAASGRTKALVTLQPEDLREGADALYVYFKQGGSRSLMRAFASVFPIWSM